MANSCTAIHIRPMMLEHLEAILDIEPVAFGSHHWSHQSFVNELNNSMGNYFVAYDRETKRLIGYSGFWLIGEEAHITTLAVHPDYRRLHIGERLLINDIHHAQKVGANWITLEVRVSNESAQQLYYKYGFKSLGVRRNYYQDNEEDALVLWTENIRTQDFKKLLQERIDALSQQAPCEVTHAAELEDQAGNGGNGKNGSRSGQSTELQKSPSVMYKGADEC
jgi:[ribosomal protein S18]-alanine N-acetyltransferase